MPSPQTILPWLLGGAIGAAGILQGLHWKSTRAPADLTELENQLRTAGEEIENLRHQNESLRARARGGGLLSVPQPFIDRAEQESGLRFLSPPVIHRTTGEALRDRIAAAIESSLGPSGIDDRQQSYRLIGWLRPDDDLLTQLTAVRSLDANGWLDEATGQGWMLDKADLKNIPDQATLVGLLTRMLIHQHFPPSPDYPGDDAARAREALHHGMAAGGEARFFAEKARTDGFMPMKENKALKQLLASLSPFLQGLASFPAVEGKGHAESLHVQGNEPVQAAFRKPPQTTREIFRPGEPAAPIALELPATPGEPFLTESAGQLGLLLWLKSHGDAASAAALAATWKNDRYSLFPDGEASAAVIWDIELDSTEAVDRLQAIALGKTTAIASLGENDTPENRHFAVVRVSPTRLRFLNTAEAATATQLSAQ